MKYLKLLLLVLVIPILTGCNGGASFHKTGDYKILEALPENCNFTVYTIAPKKDFEEVGVIEFCNIPPFLYPGNIEDARKAAQKLVCKNGGNGLLLWQATSFGAFVKATVIRVNN